MSRDTKTEKTDGAARGELSLLKLSRVVTEEDEVKSTVSAIFRVKPFAKDWKRVWEKVEAPHYGKEGLGWLRRIDNISMPKTGLLSPLSSPWQVYGKLKKLA